MNCQPRQIVAAQNLMRILWNVLGFLDQITENRKKMF